MRNPNDGWIAGLGWALCALSAFVSLGSMSMVGWACLVVVAFPPLVYLALAGGPPITIAEVLYNAERGR